jgi:hypothetical protein
MPGSTKIMVDHAPLHGSTARDDALAFAQMSNPRSNAR